MAARVLAYLEGGRVGRGGGYDDAVAHGLLLGQQTHELGDGRPLLANTDVPEERTQNWHKGTRQTSVRGCNA